MCNEYCHCTDILVMKRGKEEGGGGGGKKDISFISDGCVLFLEIGWVAYVSDDVHCVLKCLASP